MIKQYIHLDKYDWKIRIYYEVDAVWKDMIMGDVADIGIKGKDAKTAMDMLLKGEINTGFTYSNLDEGETVVVVFNGSSGAQFFNSLLHEIFHAHKHICESKKIDPFAEEAAYLMGDLCGEIYPKVKHLLCGCGKHRKDKDRPK